MRPLLAAWKLARSFDLAREALEVAREYLVQGGALICKIFEGQDVNRYAQMVGDSFRKQKRFRPAATRKASSEVYIIATGKE